MTGVRLVAEARRELLDAVTWYEGQRTKLGAEFAEAVARALDRVSQQPSVWPVVGNAGLRAYVVRRFPYTIIHGVERGRRRRRGLGAHEAEARLLEEPKSKAATLAFHASVAGPTQ